VLVVTAWVAGRAAPAPEPQRGTDAVRLGPDPGERVAEYLARAASRPAPAAATLWALVQLSDYLDPAAAAALVGGTGALPARVVFRVPLPRVQTALRTEDLAEVDLAPGDIARALRSAEGRDAPGGVALARVLTRSGTWVVLHGATLVSDGQRRVAVIIEPAYRQAGYEAARLGIGGDFAASFFVQHAKQRAFFQ